ncbi:MAG: SDR family oxidoreductase [Clostridiales bacterium]|nr:SDR family oxidoreductase [Clostridiales bacterium]
MNMAGRRAFITGASSGIGRGTARAFAAAGAKVALSARSADKLEALCEEIRGAGGDAEAFPADVTDSREVARALELAAGRFGGIDAVVHCAGMTIKGRLEEMEPQDWDAVLGTNLKSTYEMARLAYPYLLESAKERPAKFLAIGSVGTYLGIPLSAAYCASKGGLVQLVKALAVEWAARGICVNAVCPGYVWTALSESVLKIGETRKKVIARIPMRRIGEPEDIANALLFLASGLSDYITGATLNVDGGLLSAAYTMDD